MKITRIFIIFAVILTGIALSVSLVVDPMMAIFIVCVIVCAAMTNDSDDKDNSKTETPKKGTGKA